MANDRYKLVGVIGQGGMGTVFAAEDARLPGKQWAIKEIRAADYGESGLALEAETLVRLSHPGLPRIVDYYTSDDGKTGYVVMERIDGETLEQRLVRLQRKMPAADVIGIALQLCDALSYLHAVEPTPIIHRDLKPSNILIDRRGRAVLIDFGTARTYKPDRSRDTVQLGTLGFAAPEQLSGEQTDARTDLYALGAIMYYLLSGGRGHNALEPFREEHIQHAPVKLRHVVGRLLQPAMDRRYASAEAVIEALKAAELELRAGDRSVHLNAPRIGKRLIAFLSLYAGAGSTTVCLSALSMLRKLGIPHACIELPGVEPVMEEWLLNVPVEEENVETGWMDRLSGRLSPVRAEEDEPSPGLTRWLVLPRDADRSSDWTAAMQLRLLYSLPEPIVLADCSHMWQAEAVEETVALADELAVVVGPNSLRLFNETSERRMWQLTGWLENGKKVTLLRNGWNITSNTYDPFWIDRCDRVIDLPHCPELAEYTSWSNPDIYAREKRLASWTGKLDSWLSPLLRTWGLDAGPESREKRRRRKRGVTML